MNGHGLLITGIISLGVVAMLSGGLAKRSTAASDQQQTIINTITDRIPKTAKIQSFEQVDGSIWYIYRLGNSCRLVSTRTPDRTGRPIACLPTVLEYHYVAPE